MENKVIKDFAENAMIDIIKNFIVIIHNVIKYILMIKIQMEKSGYNVINQIAKDGYIDINKYLKILINIIKIGP